MTVVSMSKPEFNRLAASPRRAHFLDGHRLPSLCRASILAWKISLFKYPGERERQSLSHGRTGLPVQL